uniref:Glycoprotein S (Fragments) n=1 Tax=Transmissible gastroenteritis virus TaxID=11149 RepID=Q7LZU7_TGEV
NCIRNNSNDLYVTLENLKALYWDYATENITSNHKQRLNVVVNGYPYSITVTTTRNFNSAEGAIICICKGSPPTTTTESSLTCNWGSECRFDQCNGAVLNNTVDVIRFNLNFTTNVQSGKGATVFSLNTTGGVTLEISCYNDTVSDSSFSSYGEMPFGVTDGPRYCYVHYNGTALKYLGTLPPSVKEIAISKWGHFYINGYNFFSTFPIDCISFNLT